MGRWQWSVVVIIEVSGNKKARFMGLSGHSWSLVDNELVEAAGIEPERLWTHKHGSSQMTPYRFLGGECVVVVVGN